MLWKVPPPSSGGIILSYQCSNRCRHCLYACSPAWRDWATADNLEAILQGVAKHSHYLTGLHIAGGEPLLRPDIVLATVKKAIELSIPLDYVETNGFWCWDDGKTESVFNDLFQAGLPGILVSVSPFHQEFIPMERVNRAISIGQKIFGSNRVFIYTRYFYEQFSEIPDNQPLPFDEYLNAIGEDKASYSFATEYSLIPNGRAATCLSRLYEHHPASHFFGGTCEPELSSPHHIHVDLYGNYIAGLCAGISLGDIRQSDQLFNGVDLAKRPILAALIQGGIQALYESAVQQFGYKESSLGYIAKCHLCLDIRRHLVQSEINSPELAPIQFYNDLECETDESL